MGISIKQPAALCEKGMREINEDYIFPQPTNISPNQRFFIVCDGMGGEGKGDIAAKMVANSFANFLNSIPTGMSPTEEQLKLGLKAAEDALSAYMQMNSSSVGMGTTLSLAHFSDDKITLAWVGNSPIFFFRKRNFSLTRAEEISASGPYSTSPPPYLSEIPPIIVGKEKRAELNVRTIPSSELQEGDYIFVSTDGIMEQVDQRVLATILRTNQSPEFLVTEVENLSKGLTQDDFSCFLIQIDRVHAGGSKPFTPKKEAFSSATAQPIAPVSESSESAPIPENPPQEAHQAIESEEVPEAEPMNTQSPMATKALYLVLAGCALMALIGGTLESLGIGKPSKPFDAYVDSGRQYISQGDYDAAIQTLDSALLEAPDEARKIQVMALRNEALGFSQMDQMDLSQLKEQGDRHFQEDQWNTAITYYKKAMEVAARDSLIVPPDLQENLILAYLYFAELYDKGENNNPERSLEYYQQGLALEASDEIRNSTVYQDALNRVKVLLAQIESGETGEDQLADNSQPPSSPQDPFDDKQPTPRPTLPPNENPSTPISTPDNDQGGRINRSESLSTNERRRSLADGKSLFEQAKLSGSKSQYQSSIEHLEDAGSALDGSGAYLLSVMYHEGRSGTTDERKALDYAQKSALKGYAQGHFYYAHLLLLRERRGDTITAIKSLQVAAQAEHIEAINRLNQMGLLY